ncbi:peptidoglycan DD-metalloendopeptidase family protein [Methylocystis sp. WRRC1]|uniref:murein hydrolase activator EnvC family protein n=1 Tax=Methylocystis sp. WRRC1 TaxID=1732014 RepID=UPI001D1473A7|nr:peptidoglycan DD-metalloendopeptidase family protein [Methylocystis sp. WRRC1]MCC3245888.1 peptidoglycan DD-metalloendopeptidase family protein [Methylocystis sp. WRRC1]
MRIAIERFRSGDGRTPALAIALAVIALSAQAEPNAPDISIKREELRGVEETIGETQERAKKLEGEISSHAAVRENLNRTLLDATRRLQDTEARAAEIEERLGKLSEEERKILTSLADRRALIVEILTILQRMGRRPPPALLARPEDILEAVRASLALGQMLPQMRAETQALQSDLAELVRLRDDMRREQARLATEKTNLNDQRARLAPMIAARQEALAAAQSALRMESERAQTLARQATTLKDLIGRMEAESEAARKAAEAARKADEERAAAQGRLTEEQRRKALAAPFKDAARLAPAAAFADLKAKLPLPVAGAILKRYGAPDGYGGKEKGISIAARENGLVVAPCDGWIAFSGPYRSYGQLLIINAGGGYYVVLAGMSRTNVNVGQFVLAGEPVASMGDGAAQTAATIAIGAKQPILYVEFRKDGASIDSSPWWAKSDSRKVGG